MCALRNTNLTISLRFRTQKAFSGKEKKHTNMMQEKMRRKFVHYSYSQQFTHEKDFIIADKLAVLPISSHLFHSLRFSICTKKDLNK